MDVGNRIAELRKARGLTQQQLADALYVSRELVCKWELGKRVPDYKTTQQLADVLGVPTDRIMSEDDVVREELAGCVPAEGGFSDKARLADALDRFLKTLPEDVCDIFVRRYHFHETAGEIGAKYGIGDNYVRSILTRTRRKLKKFLARCSDGQK